MSSWLALRFLSTIWIFLYSVECLQNVKSMDLLKSNIIFNEFLNEVPSLDEYTIEAGDDDSSTFPFIEAIVQRTTKQYMRYIQTERNWLERILQSVREERVIRSRYNCSTDACIYKIQLFTHHLPKHIFEHKSNLHKRFRRSVDETNNTNSTNDTLNYKELKDDKSVRRTSRRRQRRVKRSAKKDDFLGEDDALRLPDISQPKHDASSPESQEGVKTRIDQSNPISPQIAFGDGEKINLERVSQEILSEALSRESKLINLKLVSSTSEQSTLPVTSETTEHYVEEKSAPTTESLNVENQLGTEVEVKISVEDVETSPSSSEEGEINRPTESLDVDKSTMHQTSEHIDLTETTLETEASDGSETTVQVTEAEQTSSEPTKASSETVTFGDTITFGLNKFVGKGYQNCTGRYTHYCLNALKCVYIAVLETAVCYCRPGYTGVRCDMFNLPQTLDTLRSFREHEFDITLLQEHSAENVYGVVEATARYTVNAVLEEELLSGWNDVLP